MKSISPVNIHRLTGLPKEERALQIPRLQSLEIYANDHFPRAVMIWIFQNYISAFHLCSKTKSPISQAEEAFSPNLNRK